MSWARRNWLSLIAVAVLLADIGALVLAIGVAYVLRFRLGWGPELAPNRFLFFIPVNLTLIVASVLSGLALGQYTRYRAAGLADRLVRTAGIVTVGALLTVAATFFVFSNRLEFVRLLIIYAWIAGILAVFAARTLVVWSIRALNRRGFGVERVVIVGAGDEGAEALRRILADRGRRYEVVGFLDDFDPSPATDGVGVPVLGPVRALAAVIAEHDIDKVVIALPSLSHAALLEILERTEASYADVWLLPDLFQLMVSPVTEGGVRGLPLIALNQVRLRGLSRFAKRSLDVLIGFGGLVMLSLPMLLIALAIKLESRGPVFYAQARVGRDGRRFPIVKFRTMIPEAEDYGQTWTVPNDPRITRVGRVLRRFWLDELPQLINVIKGDMSLVGPRPERPAYVRRFQREFSRYMVRHRERAGMTGWAQVNGLRGDSSIEDRTRFDLYYVENWSVLLDLRILLRTMLLVMRGAAR